jgi:hypothetical protein
MTANEKSFSQTIFLSINVLVRDWRFKSVAASTHTPAAQIVRQLIRGFIARHETPNVTIIKAMQAADSCEGKQILSTQKYYLWIWGSE